MTVVIFLKGLGVVVLAVVVLGNKRLLRYFRIRKYRGRKLRKRKSRILPEHLRAGTVRFGNDFLPESILTQHFLVAGTTGSGKSHVLRLLLESPLKDLKPGSDSRMFIFDAKGDTTAYLNRIGLQVPIYSLNPLESRAENPIAVSWDIGKDVTSPLRANNLANSMITGEASGTNGYFVKAARTVVAACIKSFIRHAGTDWRFSDLVYATTSLERMKQLLELDAVGQAIAESFLGENNTGYGVATTVCADMELYSPVAALWQRTSKRLSIREWLTDSSVLLMGEDETASASLGVLNQQIFTTFVEEVLMQNNSSTRRTGLCIDEAQLAECILRSGKLQRFAAKARSRGGCLFLAFQNIDGFHLAAGDSKAADSIIAQCSHKALLRQESYESAQWSSKLTGQYEALEVNYSHSADLQKGDTGSEQRVLRDTVLPSEFFSVPETNVNNGLTGYFVSAGLGVRRTTIPAQDIERIAVTDEEELEHAIVFRPEGDQWIRSWTLGDKQRLGLVREMEPKTNLTAAKTELVKKKKLRLSAVQKIEQLRMPKVADY